MASVESAGDKSIEVLLEEQVAYYRARASEYDDWFLRRGRYDRGVVRNLRWFEQVDYQQADLFAWRPVASYDFVFLGFWLSHVPQERFEFFWRLIAEALEPEGRVFFVDNLHHQERTPMGHHLDSQEAMRVTRTLLDGRVFEIVKIFYEPSVLEERLRSLGW